ncbi:HesA/MoeB/ThiF family protein [Streptomyces sp. NPDC051018]|uniref:HesA/MoeB/ThiF family protein n=1 Tax=Streptomyces sp. NPDC051018 TaxID=3365639 RepID=UPI0037AB0F95
MKPEHRPYRTGDGNVRIGSVVYGIGAEIRDQQGWVWSLTEAMDGTRAPGAVVAEVARTHPAVSAEDVRQAMEDLLAAGYVEDAGAAVPPELSARERDRYSRGVTLLRWMDRTPRTGLWEVQLALRASRVLLVGVGGTGGYAARALVASGVGRLHCVDPDTVELSNLNRQPLYRESDIGRSKAEAAVEVLRALNSDVTVTGEAREVRGPGELAALLTAGAPSPAAASPHGPAHGSPDGPAGGGPHGGQGGGPSSAPGGGPGAGYDLLVMAADRPPEIRRWANGVCLELGLPWVEAGYRGPLATVGAFVPRRGACWECLRATEIEGRDLRLAPGQDEEIASPRMPWNPADAVTAGLSGSLMAHAALALLTGAPPFEPGCRIGVNLMVPGEPITARSARRPDCPACGDAPAQEGAEPREALEPQGPPESRHPGQPQGPQESQEPPGPSSGEPPGQPGPPAREVSARETSSAEHA